MKIRRDWLLLLGSLLVMAALFNHYLSHSSYFLEILLIGSGTGLALFSLWKMSAEGNGKREGLIIEFLSRFLPKKWWAAFLPVLGFGVVLAWSAWKIFVSGQADLRIEDFIVTLFGLSVVLYYFGPSEFTMQKDFVVLYLFFLTLIFAVMWKLYTIVTGESYGRITGYSEYYFITLPVVWLVRAFGIGADAELDTDGVGLSNTIAYEYEGVLIRLGVGSGCSGLYSAGLFFSAFLAFVIVRYERMDARILTALGLGLLVTWFGNIFRMAVTVLIGAAYGHPAVVFVHSTFGIVIFVAFIAVFWYFIVRWLDKSPAEPERSAQADDAPSAD
ncbi:MAG: archaeosortase/exosortase family protein [Candidatus Thermoplasmatota archaeon]|nr:archaeosortase/exosortase family protein [Candidatus Thermoplasmatota archaeon]